MSQILAPDFDKAGTSPQGISVRERALNFVWLSPTFANPGDEFKQPIPEKTVENIIQTARSNEGVQIRIWIDSKRISVSQIDYLQKLSETTKIKNLSICDLRTIPAYANQSLFQQPDNNPDWRIDKHSMIWRQVDAARILACLDGQFNQKFYADADIQGLNINSDELQSKMSVAGVVLAGGIGNSGYAWYENQMFGFDNRQRTFFEKLYALSIKEAHLKHENGYGAYIDLINSDLKNTQGIDTTQLVFQVCHDGTVAHHPGQNSQLPGYPPKP